MAPSDPDILPFSKQTVIHKLLEWWDENNEDLPWRANKDPYAVWVSEIMLQQTQINTVIPYYQRWMAHFPTVDAVAEGSLDTILKMWEGLGYYSRARNLHKAAIIVSQHHRGKMPESYQDLLDLPGIGRYTAGAIASIAFDLPVPVLDGNIIRVLSRLLDLADDVNKSKTKNSLWKVAANLVPDQRPGDFNQALMELGQTVCSVKNPHCSLCPINAHCLSYRRGTQSKRPVRSRRKKIPHFDVVAGIIWQSETVDSKAPFLITQRPLDGLLGGLWEFPGGKQEEGESLPEALQREIWEELALTISVGAHLATVQHAFTHFRISLHAFFAHVKSGQPQNLGVKDHSWVTLADLEKYAFAGADHKIIVALRENLSLVNNN